MKTKALLKCTGLICIWFLSLQFFSILFRNADITRILSIFDRGYSGFLHEQKESLYLFCARGKTADADHPAGVTVRNWSVIF